MVLRGWTSGVIVLLLSNLSCRPSPDDTHDGVRFQIERLLTRPLSEIVWEVRDDDLLVEQLATLYESRDFEPVWVEPTGLSVKGQALMDALHRAPEHGLRASDYLRGVLADENIPAELAREDAEKKARVDLALSFTTMRYIKDVHEGRFNPRELGLGLDVSHNHRDLAAQIEALAGADDVAAALEALAPHYPGYRKLKVALARYRRLAREDPWRPMKDDRTIHPGEPYEDIELLRDRLRLAGYFEEDVRSGGPVYDPGLVAAVSEFQRRHSLNADGVIGSGDRASDYKMLPVMVNVKWKGVKGKRKMKIPKMLTKKRWQKKAR